MGSCVTVVAGFTTPDTPNELKVFIRKFLKRKSEKFPLVTFVYMEVSDEDRNTLNILRGDDESYPKMFHFRGGNTIVVAVHGATEETIIGSFNEVEKYYIAEMQEFQKQSKSKSGVPSKKQMNNSTDERIESNDGVFDDEEDHDEDRDEVQDEQPRKGKLQNRNQKQQIPAQMMNAAPDMTNNQIADQQTSGKQLDPALEKRKNLEKLVLLNKKSDDLKLELVKQVAKRKKMEESLEKKKNAEKKDTDGKEYRKSLRKAPK